MRKSLLLAAVIGSFSLPAAVLADDAAPAAAAPAAPASPYTMSYNIGIYSQYVFRGLTQTAYTPALQGGADFSHTSGLYLGTWGSNISWLNDSGNYKRSSLEWDIYGGFRNTIGDTGIGYDIGLLNYVYPGSKTAAGRANAGFTDPYTLELYGALSYKWLQAKLSWGLTDIFGVQNSDGSYYAELNANIPLPTTGMLSGLTANLHLGRQEYDGKVHSGGVLVADNDKLYSYTDWKVGLTKSWDNGFNLGAYYTDTNARDAGYGFDYYKVSNIGNDTFTVFLQKTF